MQVNINYKVTKNIMFKRNYIVKVNYDFAV